LSLADPIIRPLREDDGVNALSLGSAELKPLKSFLRKQAREYERASVARTYVIVDKQDVDRGGRVWGYASLVASEVHLGADHVPPVSRWPDGYSLPAVKLARMAIDQSLQGRGLGRELMSFMIALVQDHIATRIGCRLFVTDAKPSAVSFYTRMGFTMLDTEANKKSNQPVMFLLLDNKGLAARKQ
jgi:GNAT superfamily N-acetyltransferase